MLDFGQCVVLIYSACIRYIHQLHPTLHTHTDTPSVTRACAHTWWLKVAEYHDAPIFGILVAIVLFFFFTVFIVTMCNNGGRCCGNAASSDSEDAGAAAEAEPITAV